MAAFHPGSMRDCLLGYAEQWQRERDDPAAIDALIAAQEQEEKE